MHMSRQMSDQRITQRGQVRIYGKNTVPYIAMWRKGLSL